MIWRGVTAAGFRTPLDRAAIVEMALKLLDYVGLDQLSTRRLAAELGVKGPSLYWHFRNMAELHDLMADKLLTDALPSPDAFDDWKTWLAEGARAYRRAALSHRDGARILAGARPTEDRRANRFTANTGGTLVEKTVTMELAPVLTGLALAGRVGANIAAELGTMRVTEQIDALETLAYDPHAYLVVPRVLAGTVMVPIIVGVAVVVGVGAGWAASVALLQISSEEFTKGLRLFFETFDVQYGLVKAASFGTVVTWTGCMQGMSARGGAQGVGRAATAAVVYSAVMILLLDAFWAVVWLLGHKP